MRTPSIPALILVLVGALLGGCAVNSTPLEPYDPYEQTNRKVYNFNQSLDKHVLAPVASGYAKVTPHFVRQGVTNFFSNVAYPGVILNDVLQGKGKAGLAGTGRFLVNSTIGLLGVLDPATHMGLPERNEDFGQTLAVWGANSGPYLELPLFGPDYVRDVADYPVAAATNVLTYTVSGSVMLPLAALNVINTRAQLDQAVKLREQAALDPYVFTRTAFTQYRENLIHDGAPPEVDLYELDLDEDEDEDEAE